MVHIDLGHGRDIEQLNRALGPEANFLQDLDLEIAQFSIRNDEEIAAAAGGIEKGQGAELVVKRLQCLAAAGVLPRHQPPEFSAQLVEKKRLDHLQDVFFARIMCAFRPPLLAIHNRLKQRAEDRGRNLLPIETTGVQQLVAHPTVEIGKRQALMEQRAVDIGKACEIGVELLAASVLRRVENLEELRQERAEVGSVLARAIAQKLLENAERLENAGVVGE